MITKGKVVTLEYTLKNENGDVLEKSDGTPLDYLHGYQNIVTGLEEELEGLKVGDHRSVQVSPEKGYGDYDAARVLDVPKGNFGSELPEEGQFININSPEGQFPAMVKEIRPDSVVLDANHPMAGQTLHFDVEVKSVRDATEDELAHGHVHGPGCNH